MQTGKAIIRLFPTFLYHDPDVFLHESGSWRFAGARAAPFLFFRQGNLESGYFSANLVKHFVYKCGTIFLTFERMKACCHLVWDTGFFVSLQGWVCPSSNPCSGCFKMGNDEWYDSTYRMRS